MARKIPSKKQVQVLDLVRRAISEGIELSLRDMAEELNLESASTVLHHLRKLEEMGFVIRDDAGKVVRVNYPGSKVPAVAFLPLLGSSACGKPLENIVNEVIVRMVPIPLSLLGRNYKKPLYLVTAVGQSMSPKIEDGDLVVFERNPSPTTGQIITARTKEGTTIKRFWETEEQIVLKPINKGYQPLVFEKSESLENQLDIDGVVVASIKPMLSSEK